MLKRIVILSIAVATFASGYADNNDDFNKIRESALENFNKAKQNAVESYEAARRKANEDFARKLSEPWEPTRILPKENPPVEPTPPPVIEVIDTVEPQPPRPVIIKEEVPIPSPAPQPSPIEPIAIVEEEIPTPRLEVDLYGTSFSVRQPDMSGFRLNKSSGADLSRAWLWLNNDRTNNLIADCLAEREDKSLCDWAYLQLLFKVADALTGGNRNASCLLAGFLFSQSGYKMRFAKDSSDNLLLLYHTSGNVYHTTPLTIDGKKFYVFGQDYSKGEALEVCKFSFPQEKPLSFEIHEAMKLDVCPAQPRSVTAKFHPDVTATVTVNKNLIDFYNSYPTATITSNPYSKWAIYANVPASEEFKRDLYPILSNAIAGKTQLEAANILLHLAQSFPYGDDIKIWGGDRSFFADETWYYPESDCEDHAIHFTRLVRDLMGLNAVLLYYPGHLATAIEFTDGTATGDYVMKNGRKFIVCDPTIFYSNVGTTMQGKNNTEAIFIDLRP